MGGSVYNVFREVRIAFRQHRAEIDAYRREGLSQYERDREAERRADPVFYRIFVGARQHQR